MKKEKKKTIKNVSKPAWIVKQYCQISDLETNLNLIKLRVKMKYNQPTNKQSYFNMQV